MIPATGSRGILQENTGNRWNMEAVFRPEIVRIFSGGFLYFPAGTGRNTASTKSPELPRTGSFRTGLFDLSSNEQQLAQNEFFKNMFHSQKEQLLIQQRVTNEQQLIQNESLKNMVDSGNEQLKE
jgi:hypothetical protein